MKGVAFAGTAKGGQHAMARWVISLWGKGPQDIAIVARRKGKTPGGVVKEDSWPFGCLFENWTFREVLEHKACENHLVVCTVRDLLNWWASWWHYPGSWPGETSHENRVEVWRSNAQAMVYGLPKEVVFVNYNKWFTSEDYRRELAQTLGRPFTDEALNLAGDLGIHEGGGSSFQLDETVGQKLGVTNRWRSLVTREAKGKVWNPFDYLEDDLLDLNHQIFGDIYPRKRNEVLHAIFKYYRSFVQ
jgi:hypothetical protein